MNEKDELIEDLVYEAFRSRAVEKLLNDPAYLEKLHSQIMRGVRRRPGAPKLTVVEPDSPLRFSPVPAISQEIYSR